MPSENLESILAGVPLPLVLIDRTARIEASNAQARQLFGANIEGRSYVAVLRQPALLSCIEQTLASGIAGQSRYSLVTFAREVVYRVLTAPVVTGKGPGVLVSFEDVTDQEQAGQIRRDFVANVSHELRTPLTAMLGFIETLKGAARNDPVARDRFLNIMEREAERMNRLVSDLLSLSRVEAEERMRPSERVDIPALVRSSVATLHNYALEQSVALLVTGADTPVMVRADPDQLTQVFHNLIENAVKYGGPGKTVTVAVTVEPHEPGLRGPAVRIDVIDEGDGIDSVHLPRLTERFYRVDSHRSREKGGTGLGLAIVKHIVNRHRGRFYIASELGKGSRFTVVLPER